MRTVYTIESSTDPQEGYHTEAAFANKEDRDKAMKDYSAWWHFEGEIDVFESLDEYNARKADGERFS